MSFHPLIGLITNQKRTQGSKSWVHFRGPTLVRIKSSVVVMNKKKRWFFSSPTRDNTRILHLTCWKKVLKPVRYGMKDNRWSKEATLDHIVMRSKPIRRICSWGRKNRNHLQSELSTTIIQVAITSRNMTVIPIIFKRTVLITATSNGLWTAELIEHYHRSRKKTKKTPSRPTCITKNV